jgi:P4 family phage/plasmid primase-like protien
MENTENPSFSQYHDSQRDIELYQTLSKERDAVDREEADLIGACRTAEDAFFANPKKKLLQAKRKDIVKQQNTIIGAIAAKRRLKDLELITRYEYRYHATVRDEKDASWPPEPKKPSLFFSGESIAYRTVLTHGLNLAYDPAIGWLQYNGIIWEAVPSGEALMTEIFDVSRKIGDEVEALEETMADIPPSAIVLAKQKLLALQEALATAKGHANARTIAAHYLMIDTSASTPPDTILCTNGLLNLRTLQLRHPSRCDWTLNPPAVSYCPTATAPRWRQFLEETFCGDKELIEYMQVQLGYCITGYRREHTFMIFHGTGRNGKGTLVSVLQRLLGALFGVAPRDLLIGGNSYKDNTRLFAQIIDKRLVVASEFPRAGRLDVDAIQTLVSDDAIQIRKLYKEGQNVMPPTKLIVCCNEKPQMDSLTRSIWCRLRMIPFANDVPKGQEDKELLEKLLCEKEGIFAWLVAGANRWLHEGLPRCSAVENAGDEYQAEENTIALWWSENVDLDDACQGSELTRSAQLYQNYAAWCKETGHRPQIGNSTMMGRWLGKNHGKSRILGGNVIWTGLKVRSRF